MAIESAPTAPENTTASPLGDTPQAPRALGLFARHPLLLSARTGRWTWPWVLLSSLVALLVWLVLLAICLGVLGAIAFGSALLRGEPMPAINSVFAQSGAGLTQGDPLSFAVFLAGALPFLLTPMILLPLVHGVSPKAALAPCGRFEWGLFARAATAFLIVLALGYAIEWARHPDAFAYQPRSLAYLPWLIAALVVVFLQTLGEEVFFKGYLLRIWGAVVPIPGVIVPLIAGLFVSLHLGNPDVAADLWANVIAFVVIWGALHYTIYLKTRSIAAVAGIHFINNAWAFLFLSTLPGQTTSMSLFVYTDPVTSAGRSYLTSLELPLGLAGTVILSAALLLWRRSPLYLRPSPIPQPPLSRPPLQPVAQAASAPAAAPAPMAT